MTFAKWVFTIGGLFGLVMIAPLFFLEDQMAAMSGSPMTHPENYYGFVGVTFAWQLVYLVIGRNPAPYRPIMLLGALGKLIFRHRGLGAGAPGAHAGQPGGDRQPRPVAGHTVRGRLPQDKARLRPWAPTRFTPCVALQTFALERRMAFSLYDASIPVYLHMLRNLEALLAKAEGHAATSGADLSTFLAASLAPDMHPLIRQIQMTSDAAKGGAARLAAVTPPSYTDTETTWPELKARIAKTIAFVEDHPARPGGRPARTPPSNCRCPAGR